MRRIYWSFSINKILESPLGVRVGRFLAGLLFGLVTSPAMAGSLPQPPCAGDPFPGYTDVDAAPSIEVWRGEALAGWQPPTCIGFAPLDIDTVVTSMGRFREPGGMDAISERIARISARLAIKTYNPHDQTYKPLFINAFALSDGMTANPDARRADFSGADLTAGRTLRYWEEENSLLEGASYRLTVRERTPNRIVYSVVNEGPLAALLVTAVRPGGMRQLYVVEREQGDVWHFYGFVEAETRLGPLNVSPAAYINRAAAYYRYISGQPTDRDPPLALK
jgi:hypothetical protein